MKEKTALEIASEQYHWEERGLNKRHPEIMEVPVGNEVRERTAKILGYHYICTEDGYKIFIKH